MKKFLIIIILGITFSNAQTHVVPEGYHGFTVSFKNNKNVDFFGDEKFLRDSYGNEIGVGYIYDGIFGFDFSYSYSLYNRKNNYSFSGNNDELPEPSADENFNFIDNFRVENANLDDKSLSFGVTYYLNENQTLFNQSLPVNLSLGFRYGSSNFDSKSLDFLEKDFYGKFHSFEFGLYKEIETASSFYMIPRIKLNIIKEKNIVDSINDSSDSNSFSHTSNFFEIALPFILRESSAGQPFVEPSIANQYGSTHIGLRFGLLF